MPRLAPDAIALLCPASAAPTPTRDERACLGGVALRGEFVRLP